MTIFESMLGSFFFVSFTVLCALLLWVVLSAKPRFRVQSWPYSQLYGKIARK